MDVPKTVTVDADSRGRQEAERGKTASLWSGSFLILFGINVCLFGSMNMLLATMPIRFQDNGMSEGMIGLIFGGFYAACISARIATGSLAAGLGELRLLKAALLMAALGNALMLLNDSFASYFLSRIVNGAGIGAATTLMISLASKIIPGGRLAEGLGRLALGATVALAFGPLLGLKGAALFGFPVLLAGSALALSAGFAAAAALDPAAFREAGRNSCPASGLAAGQGAAPAPGQEAGRAPEQAAGRASAREAGRASGPEAGRPSVQGSGLGPSRSGDEGAAPPEKPRRGFRLPDREMALPALLFILLGGAVGGIFTFLVLYLDERGLGDAGTFFLVATLGMVSTRLFGGRLHDRCGHLFVILPCSLLMLGSHVTLFLAPGGLGVRLAALAFGLGLGALFPSLQALAIAYSPPARRTLAAALLLNGYDVGIATNAVVLGWLSELFHTYRAVYAATPLFMIAFLLVYFLNPVFSKGRREGRQSA
ncbi:MAG: MFS transporter [Deltaproteobacteria bacterium]|jgi:MFS family permease|nr:MFS transporter [Deltaproteobacteria bacterium]